MRNPIFTAMVVTSAGLALMVPPRLAGRHRAVLVVSVQMQVRLVEEPYLLVSHGDAYVAYAARVGRFVPFLGALHSDNTASMRLHAKAGFRVIGIRHHPGRMQLPGGQWRAMSR